MASSGSHLSIVTRLKQDASKKAKFAKAFAVHLAKKTKATYQTDPQTLNIVIATATVGALIGLKLVANNLEARDSISASLTLEWAGQLLQSGIEWGKYFGAGLLGGSVGGLFGSGIANALKDCQQVAEERWKIENGRCKKEY